MPTADFSLLLVYLSALRTGSWQIFKAAVREIGMAQGSGSPPPWLATVTAEQLSSLGHVEFGFEDDLGWSVCPSTLAGTPERGPGNAMLCGVRSETLLDEVRRAAQRLSVRVSVKDQRLAPPMVEVAAASEENLAAFATEADIEYAPDAARRLLGCLPTLGSLLAVASTAELPSGYAIRRFDSAALQWRDIDQIRGDGSYRFDCYRPEYRVVHNGTAKRVSQSIAIHHTLARAGISAFSIDAPSGRLSLPVIARLPTLHARALMLHVCEVPSYDPRTGLLYFALPSREFMATLEKSLQSLEELHG